VLQSVFQGVPLVGAVAGAAGGTSGSGGGGGIGSTIESVASTVLKSGLGVIPLVGGLLGLFGGGGASTPPTLTKYVMPSSIAFEGADTASGIGGADFNQMGVARDLSGGSGAPQTGLTGPAGRSGTAGETAATGISGSGKEGGAMATGSSSGSNAPHNMVDAQAMDARWFLDRSAEIAAAVRYAMLNSNSINDVVNEL
jgi:hypothetical protein